MLMNDLTQIIEVVEETNVGSTCPNFTGRINLEFHPSTRMHQGQSIWHRTWITIEAL